MHMRLRYKHYMDFSSGFVVFSTEKPKSLESQDRYDANWNSGQGGRVRGNARADGKDDRPFEYVALFDLDNFNNVFSEAEALSKRLDAKVKEVIQEWNNDNGSRESKNRRTQVERCYKLFSHQWTGKNGKKEISIYDLCLNTYAFTQRQQNKDVPDKITEADVKVRRMI
jgi:hypothetical protein